MISKPSNCLRDTKKGASAMMGLGWQELVIVLVIIMIIFGAGKLPEVARSLGMGVKEFKQEAIAPVAPTETSTAPTMATAGSETLVDGAAAQERLDAAETARADATRAEEATRGTI
jgi:sec-independent protein translocase protein TatA